MKTIWKYELDATKAEQSFAMKQGTQILDVQVQDGIPCMWALVDPMSRTEYRTFHLYSTGAPTKDEPGQYIGTFQLHGGSLVSHVFEVTPQAKEGVAM